MYNSCCAAFSIQELKEFKMILDGLRPQDFHYDVLGTPKAIVKNPMVCIGFCLSEKEASLLALSISEALTLFEAFNVIYK